MKDNHGVEYYTPDRLDILLSRTMLGEKLKMDSKRHNWWGLLQVPGVPDQNIHQGPECSLPDDDSVLVTIDIGDHVHGDIKEVMVKALSSLNPMATWQFGTFEFNGSTAPAIPVPPNPLPKTFITKF